MIDLGSLVGLYILDPIEPAAARLYALGTTVLRAFIAAL